MASVVATKGLKMDRGLLLQLSHYYRGYNYQEGSQYQRLSAHFKGAFNLENNNNNKYTAWRWGEPTYTYHQDLLLLDG